MKKMFISIIIILSLNEISSACDIYLLGQCPMPIMDSQHKDYCNLIKKHVDCSNKKLKLCHKIKEYKSAIETVKLTLKSYINQAKEKGCKHLKDKIKLSDETTTKSPHRHHNRNKKVKKIATTTETQLNCEPNYIDSWCDQLDPFLKQYLFNYTFDDSYYLSKSLSYYESKCIIMNKYSKCIDNNFAHCKQMIGITLDRLDKLNRKCIFINTKPKISSGVNKSSNINYFNVFLLIFILGFNLWF